MSELESLIVEALRADSDLANLLASVDDGTTPAVFINAAPDNASKRWGAVRTPYLVLGARRSWTATSPVDGTLSLAAVGEGDAPVLAQRLAEQVLDGAYWHPDTEPDTVTRKAGEQEVPEQFDNEGAVQRVREAAYDLLAFAAPPALTPNPVQALLDWTAAALPRLQVAPASWTRGGDPAIYWRLVPPWSLDRLLQGPQDGGLDQWWTAGARAHVLAADQDTRLVWAQKVGQALLAARRFGGMRLDLRNGPVAIDPTADPLRDGQVTARILFLNREPATPAEPLDHIVAEGDVSLEVDYVGV